MLSGTVIVSFRNCLQVILATSIMICADAPDADTRQRSNAHTMGLKVLTVTTSILSSVIANFGNISVAQHSGFPHCVTVAQSHDDGDGRTAAEPTFQRAAPGAQGSFALTRCPARQRQARCRLGFTARPRRHFKHQGKALGMLTYH